MKLDPTLHHEEIDALLYSQAEAVYGPERADELVGQIELLATMLAELARRELDLRDAPPDTSGILERGVR